MYILREAICLITNPRPLSSIIYQEFSCFYHQLNIGNTVSLHYVFLLSMMTDKNLENARLLSPSGHVSVAVLILDSVLWRGNRICGGGKFDAFFNVFLYFGCFSEGGNLEFWGGNPPPPR